MYVAIIVALYGLLLWALLGGFLITVCTTYPETLRDHRALLTKTYRNRPYIVFLHILVWYVVGLGIWPYVVKHYRH